MSLRHFGLRAQIVLSLAALLAVVFSFTALAMLWVLRASLTNQQRELGTVAAQVLVEGIANRMQQEGAEAGAGALLQSSLGHAGIVAVGVFDRRGEPIVQRAISGEGPELGGISPLRPRPFQMVRQSSTVEGDELLLIHPLGQGRGSVVAVVGLGVNNIELGRLARPVLIYLLTSGLFLLGFGYVALTSLIVRPLEALTRATDLVARGRLNVSVPVRGGREIAAAASSFNVMTKRLLEQKEKLQSQLTELERTTRELRDTQDQLVRSAKLASVGSLAAGLAHEVGNPVSAILGLAEVLLEGGLEPEEERDYQERIRKEADRVNRIIRDLLEYARANPDEHTGPTLVSEAADSAVGLMAPQKTFRLIDIQIVIDNDLPPVDVGMDQLTQVFLNLLMNAADAVDGEGAVRLRATVEDDGSSRTGDLSAAVLVDVSDSGSGVPEADLERIFEPFYTTKDPGEGTGLGLAMCEGIVSRAGGTMAAKNSPSGGLSISLRLPIADLDEDDSQDH